MPPCPPHAGSQNCMNVGQMVNYVKNVTWQTVKYIEANLGQKDKLSQNNPLVELEIYSDTRQPPCVNSDNCLGKKFRAIMVQQEREAGQLCYHEVTDITLPGYSGNTCCIIKSPYDKRCTYEVHAISSFGTTQVEHVNVFQ